MTLDNGGSSTDADDVASLVAALQIEMDSRPTRDIARVLNLDPAQATRIMSGKRRLYPHEIAALERAWQLPLGTILRRAGLVEDAKTVREAIASDPQLVPAERRIVLRTYDGSLAASHGDDASSTTVRKTRRS